MNPTTPVTISVCFSITVLNSGIYSLYNHYKCHIVFCFLIHLSINYTPSTKRSSHNTAYSLLHSSLLKLKFSSASSTNKSPYDLFLIFLFSTNQDFMDFSKISSTNFPAAAVHLLASLKRNTIFDHILSPSVTVLMSAVYKKASKKFHIFHANFYSQSQLLKLLNFSSYPSDIYYAYLIRPHNIRKATPFKHWLLLMC